MNKTAKMIAKKSILFTLFLLTILFSACQSGPDLIPLNPESRGNPGDYIEVKTESPLVQKRLDYLENHLEEHYPEVLPIELDRAFGQTVDGINIILVCSYHDGEKDTWLKAEIRGNSEGEVVGRTITTTYSIEKLEEEI